MDKNERTWGMLLHFSVFAGYVLPLAGLIAPIVIWQIKKDEFPSIDVHGKNVMNFLISMFIYGVVAVLLTFVIIGIPLLALLGIVGIVFPIIGGIKANNGEIWKYPGMLQLIQ
ncbi:MAG: DUF4870 domain-containing protein [Planctomycetota bacterium]|jgi:uncharacterized Tic20 family protein